MSLKVKNLDPRVIRTRRDLVDSLCTLMREKPFNKIRVQDIANQAIINRATFYAHFEDKYALLEYLVLGAFQQMLDQRIGSDLGFTIENLRLLTLTACEFLKEFNERHTPKQGGGNPPIERIVQPYICELILNWLETSEKSVADELNGLSELGSPIAIATITSWSIFGPALHWSCAPNGVTAETRTNQIMAFLEHGIGL